MALIKCPECQNQISDKAVACPHCGHPIAAGADYPRGLSPSDLTSAVRAEKRGSGQLQVKRRRRRFGIALLLSLVGLGVLLSYIGHTPEFNPQPARSALPNDLKAFADCAATIKMRGRIASPSNTPREPAYARRHPKPFTNRRVRYLFIL